MLKYAFIYLLFLFSNLFSRLHDESQNIICIKRLVVYSYNLNVLYESEYNRCDVLYMDDAEHVRYYLFKLTKDMIKWELMPNGVYFVKVEIGENRNVLIKMIKIEDGLQGNLIDVL